MFAFNELVTRGRGAKGTSCSESEWSSEAEELSDDVLRIRCFCRRWVIAEEVEEALKKVGERVFSQCLQNQKLWPIR
jgi:hypothetical protein